MSITSRNPLFQVNQFNWLEEQGVDPAGVRGRNPLFQVNQFNNNYVIQLY